MGQVVCRVVVGGNPFTFNPDFMLLHQFNNLLENEADLGALGAAFLQSTYYTLVVQTDVNVNLPEA